MIDFKERLISFVQSRIFPLFLVLFVVLFVLVTKIFSLQIVHGDEYISNFTLRTKKDVAIDAVRGNIYDRNGVLLAYNDLSYSVIISDTIASGPEKNETLNHIILQMVSIIEENGDDISSDFSIYLDENENYCFSVEGTQKNRFIADIYGKILFDDLTPEQKNANPDQIIDYLCGTSKFGIGTKMVDHEGKTSFATQMGYNKKQVLDLCNIRYNLSLNGYQKYLSTTIASDVSQKTVASIMENSDVLEGVSIREETIRKYNYPQYYSSIIGYTGRINQAEYEEYSLINPDYSTSDIVGKTGIEYSMEQELQGKKGSKTIYVDNLGKILETTDVVKPVAGNDVYLTIDTELQVGVYRLLEQKIAGIILAKLENAKEAKDQGRSTGIAIYEVYAALFNNNVIDIGHMSKSYAGDTESAVYSKYLVYKANTLNKISTELKETGTVYNKLSTEMQVYESYIVTLLGSSNYGLLKTSEIDTTDPMFKKWREDETISLKQFLTYAISKEWVDVTKLSLKSEFADSSEIYEALVDYTIEKLDSSSEFSKKLYKYMLLGNVISPKEVCIILWEQDVIQVSSKEINALKSGAITPYSFIYGLIEDLKLTPAQLALMPCSGSVVIADVNTGEPLALVSYPGYDNNRLSNNADASYLAKLNQDNSKPLWNYATQQRSAPGSTFKMVSSVAGLEEGVITLSSTLPCSGPFEKLQGSSHKCWVYPGSHGNLTVTGAIAHSCNNYFYEVGYRLANDGGGYNDPYGISRLYIYADAFGLSETSGVEITESEPKVSDQYPVVSAIGQGTHNYTTVGLSRYVTAVANSGTVYEYSLISKIVDSGGNLLKIYTPTIRNQIYLDTAEWNAIHSGMRQVIEMKAFFNDFVVKVAGKTGTAQEATNRPNHALFVCYAPYENPSISVTIRIANGYASDYTAQLGKDVLSYYFEPDLRETLISGKATTTANAASNGD